MRSPARGAPLSPAAAGARWERPISSVARLDAALTSVEAPEPQPSAGSGVRRAPSDGRQRTPSRSSGSPEPRQTASRAPTPGSPSSQGAQARHWFLDHGGGWLRSSPATKPRLLSVARNGPRSHARSTRRRRQRRGHAGTQCRPAASGARLWADRHENADHAGVAASAHASRAQCLCAAPDSGVR